MAEEIVVRRAINFIDLECTRFPAVILTEKMNQIRKEIAPVTVFNTKVYVLAGTLILEVTF